jgi:hypothetical protein
MARKTIDSAVAPSVGSRMLAISSPALPWTLAERMHCIEAMGQRIDGYIRFMCEVGNLNNASIEAKERAVKAFYERMLVVEKQLGRIHDELRLE